MKLTSEPPKRPRGRVLQVSRIESVGTEASPARERIVASLPFHTLHDRPPTVGTIGIGTTEKQEGKR
jgi:hypothetical protein